MTERVSGARRDAGQQALGDRGGRGGRRRRRVDLHAQRAAGPRRQLLTLRSRGQLCMLSFSGTFAWQPHKKKLISEVCLMQPHMSGWALAVSCAYAQQDGLYAQL